MFLTSAMATNTMLYIGFSFTDDYLNEFRAEVLKMLRPQPHLPAQYETVLAALNKIGKAELLSKFYEARTNDDHLNLLAAPQLPAARAALAAPAPPVAAAAAAAAPVRVEKASPTRNFEKDKETIRDRLAAIPGITGKDVDDIAEFMKKKAFASGRRPIDLVDPDEG
jgi:hypothetical protein